MIRDKGPLSSLGHGVTSRDVPINEGESEGPSPNSGALGRALNGHPMMRFVAANTAAVLGAGIASSLFKKGGLKLAKTIDDSARVARAAGKENFSTRAVESVGELRRVMDTLQGVSRTIGDGVDPDYFYDNLVLETAEGGLTTGYSNAIKNNRYGMFFTDEEVRQARRGLTHEPAAVWAFRDQLQQKLVSGARQLPYMLPAMYVTQRAVTDPLFGKNDPNDKVTWYNPVDVVADFAKQSVINTFGILMPTEVAGAATSTARRALNTKIYSAPTSQFQANLQRRYVSLDAVLKEVGNDVLSITNKVVRTSTQFSSAFNSATTAARLDQPTQDQVFRNARELYRRNKSGPIDNFARRFFLGDPNQPGSYGLIDAIPAFRGMRTGFHEFSTKFRNAGEAYDVVTNAITFDKARSNIASRLPTLDGDELLRPDVLRNKRLEHASALLRPEVERIQGMHSSRLSNFVSTIADQMGGINSYGDRYRSSDSTFFQDQMQKQFRSQVERSLVDQGASEKAAKLFAQQMRINRIPKANAKINETQLFGFGKDDIFKDGPDFFLEMANRAKQIKGLGPDSGLSGDVIERALKNANAQFRNKEFQNSLKRKINEQWKTFYEQKLTNHTEGLLKPQKEVYESFSGQLSFDQKEFLQRKSAQVLGLKLVDEEGRKISSEIIEEGLARNGLDASNFASLRSFLIQNNKMTKPGLSGGVGFLGIRPVSYEEARDRRFFDHMNDREQRILLDLNRRLGLNDPVSESIGRSSIDGLYASRNGQMVDMTKLTGTARALGNFFAEEFEIPIIHLNLNNLFARNQFQEMGKKSPIHFVPGGSVQPFGEIAKHENAEFFVYETKRSFLQRSKGMVTAYSYTDEGELVGNKLAGLYRPLDSMSQGFIARQAQYASNMVASTGTSISEAFKGVVSDFKEGRPLSLTQRIRSAMDVAEDQPSSIFGLVSRFRNRRTDVFNPTVIANLLKSESGTARIGSRELRLDIAGEKASARFSVIDTATGKQVADNETFIRAASRFFQQQEEYGFSQKVMQAVSDSDDETIKKLFAFNERRSRPGVRSAVIKNVSEIKTVEDAIKFAQDLKKVDENVVGLSPKVRSSFSRVEQLLRDADLLATSSKSAKSPSINYKLDELKSELFSYLGQRNASIRSSAGVPSEDPLIAITNAISALRTSGRISANEVIEAQAAALSTLYTSATFGQYAANRTGLQNTTAAIYETINRARSSSEIRKLLNPSATGEIKQLSTGLRRPFSDVVPMFNRMFGTSDFIPNPTTAGAFGSNQSTVFVPTFGTVFGKDPLGAISSALGFTTYSDPESYSTASAVMGHSVERLNKYFGTLGMQLDVNNYGGPIDLFARGMVGKRMLPLVAGGSTLMAVDRTIGGMQNERDQNGERVYSPFFTGIAATGLMEAQSAIAGAVPGGMSYQEKREQLTEGEVPIRQGRFWPLGNTPFEGGKIQYYRPSWYRKLQAGALFTSDTYGSPAEKALFYNDFSPLRPLDPYRFERKHYEDRPYPVTGEYFTGPWGPVTSVLNATVGKILKPQQTMHEQELQAGLINYTRVGQSGAFDVSGYLSSDKGIATYNKDFQYLEAAQGLSALPRRQTPIGADAIIGSGSSPAAGMLATQDIALGNSKLAAMAQMPLGSANNDITTRIANQNAFLTNASYGPPRSSGLVPPKIVPAGAPISQGSLEFQASEIAYRAQEMAGIYGFMAGSVREKLGFGQSDFEPQRSVLQSASKAYGTSRAFYDLNLGGLGDVPLPGQGPLGNIELSEVVRRFIPRERTGVDYINPIRNRMADEQPFLPGADYFINFKTGDPFTKVQEGEIRLPGKGYERLNTVLKDPSGQYSPISQLEILGDVAPYSSEFRSLNRSIGSYLREPEERSKLKDIRQQVDNITRKEEFSQYKYRYSSADEMDMSQGRYVLGRAAEYIAHRDTIFNTKFLPQKTAVEDWERQNVYGATFPEWQRPYESFIEPMVNKATQRNPIAAAGLLGLIGSSFGITPRAKILGSTVGSLTGAAAGTYGGISEAVTGERFIPQKRKKQMALEEYSDILSYVKNTSLAAQAQEAGDVQSARQFRQAAKRTMYGADIYGASVENLSLSIPKRKREHFKEMISETNTEERERILSTAPRLERRIYQAAWGMPVEKRPDLTEYFTQHELPAASWEGWHPNTNMEHVKIKMGQSMGVEMSQMGYYPQQIKEANLTNPSYPAFAAASSQSSVLENLKRLMLSSGIDGTVTPVMNPFPGNSIDMSIGVN